MNALLTRVFSLTVGLVGACLLFGCARVDPVLFSTPDGDFYDVDQAQIQSIAENGSSELPKDSLLWIGRNNSGTKFSIVRSRLGSTDGTPIEAAYSFVPTLPFQDMEPMSMELAEEVKRYQDFRPVVPLGGETGGYLNGNEDGFEITFPHELGKIGVAFDHRKMEFRTKFPDYEHAVAFDLAWSPEELEQGMMRLMPTSRGIAYILSTQARPNEARVVVVEDGAIARDISMNLPRSLGYKLFGGWRSWLEIDGEGKHLMFINTWPPPPGLYSGSYVAHLETGDFTSVKSPRGKVLWGARMGAVGENR